MDLRSPFLDQPSRRHRLGNPNLEKPIQSALAVKPRRGRIGNLGGALIVFVLTATLIGSGVCLTETKAETHPVVSEKSEQAPTQPGIFELRLVAKQPSDTTESYSLPSRNGKSETVVAERKVLLDQNDLISARVQKNSEQNLEILLSFNDEGTRKFGDITEKHVSDRLAIFVDGHLQSAPVIRTAIYGGTAIISGNFSE